MTLIGTSTKEQSFNPCVSSHGYSDADIFFLQGYPQRSELTSGLALSGFNESTLNQFLYPLKLNLKQCYRSSFIKEGIEYMGTNSKRLRNTLYKINYDKYLDLLFNELNDIKPNIVVPLDDIALGAVFPHIKTINKPKGRKHWVYCYRGSILPLRADWASRIAKFIKVIPTLSPYLLEVDWAARSYVGLDFKRIKEYSISSKPIDEYGLCWSTKLANEFEKFLSRQYAKLPDRVTFDIETYGGLLTCISFCFDGYESCTVPLIDNNVSPAELYLIWVLVGKVLANEKIEKNNQNIKYDITILERMGFKINNVRSDTMLKGKLLYPELPAGLDFYTSIYTPIPYYKDEGKEYNPRLHTRERLYLYCAKDSLAAHYISRKQDEDLEEVGMKNLYEKEIAPLIIVYKNIDITGILIDDTQKKKLREKYTNLFNSNLVILRNLVGNENFNPNSNPQVGTFIYEDLKFPVRKHRTETNQEVYDTGKETLDDLLINHSEKNRIGEMGCKILQRIIICRKLRKVLEYIDTPLALDGTFRGSFNLCGTDTGRSSCSKTIDDLLMNEPTKSNKWIKKIGRSLQTITKHGFVVDEDIFEDETSREIANDLRSMFVPHHKYYFIECDGKGAEARVVFVLAEDYDALLNMDTKPSIHAKTIGMILNLDPNTITKDGPYMPDVGITYYDLGKRIRHAGHNGMEAYRLSMYIHAKLDYCQMLMNKFHSTNPKIKSNFHDPLLDFVRKHRYVITPHGRRRDFFNKMNNKHYDNVIKSQIQQATVSDLTKFTMPRVINDLNGYMTKYKFLTEQHDGILAEVHKDYIIPYTQVFKTHYERKIDFRRCSLSRDFELTIPVEISISDKNWMELKDYEI